MNGNEKTLYEKIVGKNLPPKYTSPEQQGRSIKKCTILESIEIEYNSSNRTKNYEN